MHERFSTFQEAVASDPSLLRDTVRAIDASSGTIDTTFLDCLFGIPILGDSRKEHINPDADGLPGADNNDYTYEGTEYMTIRHILHFLELNADDVVMDLGSGYGRFGFYVALATDARIVGVELVKRRVQKAEETRHRFGISNLSFVEENIVDVDLSEGNIFYLYNPFYPHFYDQQLIVQGNLKKLGAEKPITVVANSMAKALPLNLGGGFEMVHEKPGLLNPLRIYKSV
jgi:hypothetical protein